MFHEIILDFNENLLKTISDENCFPVLVRFSVGMGYFRLNNKYSNGNLIAHDFSTGN